MTRRAPRQVNLREHFLAYWKLAKASPVAWTHELVFAPPRKWRFDLAHVPSKVAIEFDGGTYVAGRHVTGSGYGRDCEKMNAAVAAGWAVLRYTTQMMRGKTWDCVEQVQAVIQMR